METFIPKGNIHGPILPQFVLGKSITFGAKTMYAILCDYAANKDHCWPSQTTLAKRLSCSISSVKNYLAELVKARLIFVKREQYRSSVYYLLRPEENVEEQKAKLDDKQSKSSCHEVKSGYLTALGKQRKEKGIPPSPHVPAEESDRATRNSLETPTAGGVSSSLSDFERVWSLYPKKEAKGFARIAWLKLFRSGQLPPIPELHAAILRFASSEGWQREQGRFVPQMGNWLRGQRWLDALPSEEQAATDRKQSVLLALRLQEEQELRLQKQQDAKKAQLRPLFNAFAAKFQPIANDAMPFGIWLYLHSQNRAPSADDVPPENSLGIVEFLNEFKRRRQPADSLTKRQSLNIRREAETPCRSVGDILKSLPVSRFLSGGEQPERATFAYA